MVQYSHLQSRVDSLAATGSDALKAHTADAQSKFIDQEKRLTRLETIEEQNSHRLTNIETLQVQILRELRK